MDFSLSFLLIKDDLLDRRSLDNYFIVFLIVLSTLKMRINLPTEKFRAYFDESSEALSDNYSISSTLFSLFDFCSLMDEITMIERERF